MMNELEFREFDHDDYVDADDSNTGGINNANNKKQDAIEEGDKEKGESPMQAAFRVLNEADRLEDKRRRAEAEMNIDDYKVEPMTSECMSDFLTLESNTDLSLKAI